MSSTLPHSYGRKSELDTPCLCVDLDALDANLATMQSVARAVGKQLRPHAKTHKCTRLAQRQIRAGALGVCVAKVSEAEVLVGQGVAGVLVTGPMATPTKIGRFVECVVREPSTLAVVDDAVNAQALSRALSDRGLVADVLVDVDVGLDRTGVSPAAASALADAIRGLPGLRLRGVQAYAGQVQHVRSHAERRRVSLACLAPAEAAFRALAARHAHCDIFSGGGTGTHDIDVELPELTELQVGSYALMDTEYADLGSAGDPVRFTSFLPALTLLTHVVSVRAGRRVTVDAGLKALYRDGGRPRVVGGEGGCEFDWFGDEYGLLTFPSGTAVPASGALFELMVSHCDPTVNLFDVLHVTRGDRVVDVWPVDLRGRSQ